VRVQSADARSLSLGFSSFDLPTGAQLYVHAGGGTTVRGPYTGQDATGGGHWTPLVHGDEILVELEVPGDRRSDVSLVLSDVVHADRAVFPSNRPRVPAKSGSCNLDVACDEADPWRRQERSVALYTYERNGNAYVCTGSLMNNTAEDERPFFLTAEHCVSSPTVAETMVFYWNYQNATCRSPGTYDNGTVTADDRDAQTASGALLRARFGGTHQDGTITGTPDLALVEVDDDLPMSYNLFFNGWSRGGTGTTAASTVHHPAGHGKRISFDQEPTAITAYGEGAGSGTTHLRVGNWERGTTEGGSSGAPLYDTNRRVVGVLSGGRAGCVTGSAEDNDEPDWYGRLAPGFQKGDYTPEGFSRPATLADWLDPVNSDVTVLDGHSQSGGGQIAPPATLTARADADSIRLEWTASSSDKVGAYRVYRSRDPVATTPVAQAVTEPLTEIGGGTTTAVDTAVLPDTTYHYRVAAVNSSAVESGLSPEASTRITVPGVHLGDGRSYNAPVPEPGTDQNPVGRFWLSADETGAVLSALRVENEASGFTGVTSAALWRSSDPTFEPTADSRLATTSTTAPVAFDALGFSLPTDTTYFFVTLDLEDDATGEFQPVLRNEDALSFSEGTLAVVRGTPTWHFENARLSGTPAPLPVELLRFDARLDGGTVHLSWKTAAETDNAGFRVQRRARETAEASRRKRTTDKESWHTVGLVEGRGTTSRVHTYQLTDADLPFAANALTYRLQQVDTDGSRHDVQTTTVERGVRTVQLLGPAPNPARRRVTIPFALPRAQPISLVLYDVMGRTVRTIAEGEGAAGRHEHTVDLNGLSSGLYVLRLRAGETVRARKLTVVR
jgi:lysyl endopeptidase